MSFSLPATKKKRSFRKAKPAAKTEDDILIVKDDFGIGGNPIIAGRGAVWTQSFGKNPVG
eukprot:m.289191 g.289191  ORF g.289191 m.289191 type:complete len:60 (-) comp187135_c0_seq1:18-197(-)